MQKQGVEIRGLTKRYPRSTDLFHLLKSPRGRGYITALDGIDLSISRGGIYGLLGRNGAGKTTLLKILAGLVLPNEGKIFIDGEDVTGAPQRIRSKVGLIVSDERSFYWRLTARENLRFFATLQRLTPKESRKRIDECLENVGLRKNSEQVFKSYSTGMRQRLAIARGLLINPPILLLDEPTRSLDPGSAARVRELVRELSRENAQRIIIYTTNNLYEAEEMCESVTVLSNGKISAMRDLKDGLGESLVRLRTRQPLPADLLQKLSLERAGEGDGTHLLLRLKNGERLDEIIDLLRARGVGILELRPIPAALEELFVDDGEVGP